MHRFLVLKLLTSLVCVVISESLDDTNIIVSHEITGDGFHRILETIVEIGTSLDSRLKSKCHLGLHQILPSNVFVDPEQLNELFNTKKLSRVLYYLNEPVNIEASENVSPQINVIAIHSNENTGDVLTSDNRVVKRFTLPIHIRYHSPKYRGHYSEIVIKPSASLLIRCSSWNDEILTDTRLGWTVEHLNSSLPCDVKSYRYKDHPILCDDWYRIISDGPSSKVKIHEEGLLLNVPIGDLNDLYLVKLITLTITNLSAVYILYSLFCNYRKS